MIILGWSFCRRMLYYTRSLWSVFSEIRRWVFYMFDKMFVSCLGISPKPNFPKFQVHFSFFFLLSFFQPPMFEFISVFLRMMNRWYWILLEVSSVFSLPYSFVVVPLEKKLIFVKVFQWKLFVTTVCINLKSIILK